MRPNRLRSILPTIAFALLISIWSPARLAAQLAGIVGSISDPSGASIRAATVRATNTVTGLEWQTKTSSQGDYSLGLLPPGLYVVEAVAAGFSPAREDGVELAVNSTRHIDLRLALPEVKENLSAPPPGTPCAPFHRPRKGMANTGWPAWSVHRGRKPPSPASDTA